MGWGVDGGGGGKTQTKIYIKIPRKRERGISDDLNNNKQFRQLTANRIDYQVRSMKFIMFCIKLYNVLP